MSIAISAARRELTPAPTLTLVAIVDSGADRTFLPLAVARLLGIASDELVRNPRLAMGIEGEGFSIWSSTVPIEARIVADIGRGPSAWGPRLRLDPAFSEKDAQVLGRRDFFRSFAITFEEGAARSALHLTYDETWH